MKRLSNQFAFVQPRTAKVVAVWLRLLLVLCMLMPSASFVAAADAPQFGNDSTSALRTQADALSNYYFDQYMRAQGWRWMETTQINFGVFSGNSPSFGVNTFQPLTLKSELDRFMFAQGQYQTANNTLNVGLGYRGMNGAHSSLYGVNLFYDWQLSVAGSNGYSPTGTHYRAGLGVEYFTGSLEFRANGYYGLSDRVQTSLAASGQAQFEKVVPGADLSLASDFSFVNAPWLKLGVTGNYYKQQTAGSTINGYSGSPLYAEVNASLQVMPQLNISGRLSFGNGAASNSSLGVQFNLLAPPQPAMLLSDPNINALASTDISYKMLQPVQRNNVITVEKFTANANLGIAGSAVAVLITRPDGTPVVNAQVTAHAITAGQVPTALASDDPPAADPVVTDATGAALLQLLKGSYVLNISGTDILTDEIMVDGANTKRVVMVADVPDGGTVTVTASDSDGAPLANETVTAYDSVTLAEVTSAQTGSNGLATLTLPVGTYKIAIMSATLEGTVNVSSGENSGVTLQDDQSSEVEYTLQDNDDQPIAGTVVYARDPNSHAIKAKAVTDAQGKVKFHLRGGDYIITNDYSDEEQSATTNSREHKVLHSNKSSGKNITVRAKHSDGSAWTGVTVYAQKNGASAPVTQGVTDASGNVHFQLANGRYLFYGSNGASANETVNKNQDTFYLDGAEIEIDVDDVVSGMTMCAYRAGDGVKIAEVTVGKDGKALFMLPQDAYKFAPAGDNDYSDALAAYRGTKKQLNVSARSAVYIYARQYNDTPWTNRWINVYSNGSLFGTYQGDVGGKVRVTLPRGKDYSVAISGSNIGANFSVKSKAAQDVFIYGGTVRINVTDGNGGIHPGVRVLALLNGVQVAAETTDSASMATFNLAAGDYEFQLDGTGLDANSTASVSVHNRALSTGTLQFAIANIAVSVALKHADGSVWPGRFISARNTDTNRTIEALTDAQGRARFMLIAGHYKFTTGTGMEYSDTIASGYSTIPEFRGGDLAIGLYAADGSRPSGDTATVYNQAYVYVASGTIVNGKLALPLTPGQYRLEVSGRGFKTDLFTVEYGKTFTAALAESKGAGNFSTVYKNADGQPWVGKWVSVWQDGVRLAEGITNASGIVRFRLPAGTYTFKAQGNVVSSPVYYAGTFDDSFNLVSGDARVTLAGAGVDYATARIEAVDGTGKVAAADDCVNGVTRLALADGSYYFRLYDKPAVRSSGTVSITHGQVTDGVIDLRNAALAVQLIDGTDQSLAKVRKITLNLNGVVVGAVKTGRADGIARFANLAPGTYTVLTQSSLDIVTVPLALSESKQVTVHYDRHKTHTRLHVKQHNGQNASGATITVYDSDGDIVYDATAADSTGLLQEDFYPGDYYVIANYSGQAKQSGNFTVTEGSEQDHTTTMN